MGKGKQITATELADDIQMFIDGSATLLDSDDINTFALADPELELIRGEVLDVLWRGKWTEDNPWCDESGVSDLITIRAKLQN